MRHTRLALVGIALCVLLVLLIAAGFLLRWNGARQRAEELLALAAASQPVLPEDLAREDDPRPEPTPWFAQLVAAGRRWEPSALADPARYAALRERARQGQLGAEAEEAFARLDVCAGGDAAAAVQRVLAVLDAHDGIVEVPACGLEAVRLLSLGVAPEVEVARLARDYGAVDPGVVASTLDASGAAFAQLPLQQSSALADALELEVLRALWSDRSDLVPDLLRAEGDVARIFAGAQLLVGALAADLSDARRLEMLELALSRLPRDTDLAWLEAELDALRPRARLARAAAGECAFGNRAFERLRKGAKVAGLQAPPRLPPSLTASYDQARHIRTWRERIERIGLPAFRRTAVAPPGWIERQLAPITCATWNGSEMAVGSADRLEARLVLARAALRAFRSDAKELLEFVATTTDPYDGKPIRAGFGSDGIVLLWSVGPDRVDDGGLDDERDVVWRFRPR